MITRAMTIALTAVALALPLFAEESAAARSSFSFTDPLGDVTAAEGMTALDIVEVSLSSDGESVVVAVTLAEPPKPVTLFDALVAGVAFDVDEKLETGGHGFAGMYGPVPGMDFESEIIASVDEGEVSKTSGASVSAIDSKGNQSFVLTSSDSVQTPAKGKVYTGKVAYSSIGAKSGQTIRVIVRELDDRGETFGMFPAARLKLK